MSCWQWVELMNRSPEQLEREALEAEAAAKKEDK